MSEELIIRAWKNTVRFSDRASKNDFKINQQVQARKENMQNCVISF